MLASGFCLCKYLKYPSGTKESKYTLGSGGEVHDRSGGCHRSSGTVLHPHRAREGKYRPQTKEQGGSRITFQPLRLYRSQEPAVCVILPNPASSGVEPPIFTPETLKKPRYEHDNLLDRRRRKLKPTLPREEVEAACRQAPDGHVREGNRFL